MFTHYSIYKDYLKFAGSPRRRMEDFRSIKENLDTADDPAEVLSLLEQLEDRKKEVTLEILKTSQLGLSVGGLKKRYPNDKKIIELSKTLIADWKSSLSTSSTPDKPPANGTKATPVRKETPAKNEEPTSDKKRKSTTAEEKPAKRPAPSPVPAGNDRDRVRILLTEAIGAAEEGDSWDPTDLATTIEEELHTIYGDTNKDYKAKFRSLSFNLTKNATLRRNVMGGSLPVEKLCRMTSQEMASEEEQKKRKEIEKWHIEAATIGKMEASTDQFLCGKCKNRKCTYYQMQTRSADEPMTTFVTCTVCNNRWKFC